MASGSELILRRVVVALDAATDCAAAIEMAASVAAGWGAALRAMFVEDEGLRRLAGLPFAQQVDPTTAMRSRLDEVGLRAEFAAQARQLRRELEEIAGRHDLQWSFEVTRAAIGTAALSLTEDDLVVVAVSTRPIASRMRLDSPWRRVASQLRQPMLLVPEQPTASGPVAAFYESTQAGQRALEASIRIARAGKRSLFVVMREEATQTQRVEVEALLRPGDAKVTLLTLPAVSKRDLQDFIVSSRATLLVFGRDGITGAEATESLPLLSTSALLVL
jgi:nucleotide-binding universal stress UspA family protein